MPSLRPLALAALLLPTLAFAETSCKFAEIMTLPVAKMKQTAALEVAGAINGEPATMVLDTGAQKTYLVRDELEKRHIVMEGVNERVRGVGGVQLVFAAKPREVSIGALRVKNKRFPVVDSLQGRGMAALLGADFLLNTDMELHLSEGKVRFFEARGCEQRGLSYWDPDALEVPLVDMEKGGRPVVQVTLNGVKGLALLDTGASRSVVMQHFAEQAGFDPARAAAPQTRSGTGIGTDPVSYWTGNFKEFTLGSETIRQPELVVSSLKRFSDNQFDMILGLDFLMAHRLLISVSQSKLYLSYSGGEVFSSRTRW